MTPKRHIFARKHTIWCKDRENRSNVCWDIKVFSRWRTSAILHLRGLLSDYPRRVLGGRYQCWINYFLNAFHLQNTNYFSK